MDVSHRLRNAAELYTFEHHHLYPAKLFNVTSIAIIFIYLFIYFFFFLLFFFFFFFFFSEMSAPIFLYYFYLDIFFS